MAEPGPERMLRPAAEVSKGTWWGRALRPCNPQGIVRFAIPEPAFHGERHMVRGLGDYGHPVLLSASPLKYSALSTAISLLPLYCRY